MNMTLNTQLNYYYWNTYIVYDLPKPEPCMPRKLKTLKKPRLNRSEKRKLYRGQACRLKPVAFSVNVKRQQIWRCQQPRSKQQGFGRGGTRRN